MKQVNRQTINIYINGKNKYINAKNKYINGKINISM